MRRRWSMALWAGISGCALLSKSEPTTPRYFTPVPAKARSNDGADNAGLELRLGAVSAGAEIRQSLAVRSSSHELTYSQDQRWTEKPEAYLRRALARAFFEERGIRRIVSGPGPTLEVELIAFEQVTAPPRARASVVVVLHDERLVQKETTLTVERPLAAVPGAAAGPEASVDALSLALTEVVDEIADDVTARLKDLAEHDRKDSSPESPPHRKPDRREPAKPEPEPDSQPVSELGFNDRAKCPDPTD